jgi:hypothetical protein
VPEYMKSRVENSSESSKCEEYHVRNGLTIAESRYIFQKMEDDADEEWRNKCNSITDVRIEPGN